jgi:hypothetical protein
MLGLIASMALVVPVGAPRSVLIVADEIPAMRVLADRLKALEGVSPRIVTQQELPGDLSAFSAVVVYIHGALSEATEEAAIRYTEAGGQLVVLHHSISSGKRANKHWFGFLGVELPAGEVALGGYKWIEGVSLEFACLAPRHFITAHEVSCPARVAWKTGGSKAGERALPGFELDDTEVYLNHVLTSRRTLLLGFRYTDRSTGKTYAQERAGWLKRAGKGRIIYLMPGHSAHDFEDPTYSRIVANAVVYAGKR